KPERCNRGHPGSVVRLRRTWYVADAPLRAGGTRHRSGRAARGTAPGGAAPRSGSYPLTCGLWTTIDNGVLTGQGVVMAGDTRAARRHNDGHDGAHSDAP